MENLFNALHMDIHNLWLLGLVESVIILILAFLFLFAGDRFLAQPFRRFLQFFQEEPDEELVNSIHNLYRRLILLLAFDLIVSSFPLPRGFEDWISGTIFVLIVLLILLSVFDLTNVLAGVLKVRAREFEPLVTKISKMVASLIALMIVMRHFNYDIWHIMTALGVGTLAVGLAAQPTLSNMIAGFTILIDRPFRPGDRIALSGGESGDVMQIGMRSTRIYTPDGNLLVVSNSDMVNSRLTNFSLPNKHLSDKVKFCVSHDSPINDIKTFLRNSIQNLSNVVNDSVQVLAVGITDKGVEMGVMYNVQNFALTATLADQVIDVIITELSKRGIRLAVSPTSNTAAKT